MENTFLCKNAVVLINVYAYIYLWTMDSVIKVQWEFQTTMIIAIFKGL